MNSSFLKALRATLLIAGVPGGLLHSVALVEAETESFFEHETLVIVGAPGEERFEKGFQAAAEAWKKPLHRHEPV